LQTIPSQAADEPTIQLKQPRDGDRIFAEDSSLSVEVSIRGIRVPQEATALLYMDGNVVGEVKEPDSRVELSGMIDVEVGEHEIKAVLAKGGESLGFEDAVTVTKLPPREMFSSWDARFNDNILEQLEEACARVPLSGHQFPWTHPNKPQLRIALGLPVMSARFTAGSSVDDDMAAGLDTDARFESVWELPIFSHFFPSLRQSLQADDGFSYRVYFGYDSGDPLYDNAENRAAITRRLTDKLKPLPISFKWIGYPHFQGKVFWIYNDLFRQAYADGSDYFYMMNDDVRLLTKGWAKRYVDTLLSSPVHPNFGVVGPVDVRDVHKTHMTFAFHHRTHFEIFGEFYPNAFPNWWSDNWMSLVFGRNATFWLRDVQIHNTQMAGQRYQGFWQGGDLFEEELQRGRLQVMQYCNCLSQGGRWRFGGCIDSS